MEIKEFCKKINAVPMSVIDDIKAEIESMMKRIRPRFESMEVVVYTRGFNDGICNALKIIDKHIGERSE